MRSCCVGLDHASPWLNTAPCLLPRYQDGTTPLIIASKNGHLDIVKELLFEGAAVDKAAQVHCEAFVMWLRIMHVHPFQLSGSQGK